MNGWMARYEEGYVTTEGQRISVTDELHDEHPWQSPAEAKAQWAKREDLTSPNVTSFENGLLQTDDVRARPAFAELGIIAIWRRVTFERSDGR